MLTHRTPLIHHGGPQVTTRDMWRHLRGVLVFLLLLGLLPLAAVFLLKVLLLAGAWTLESLTDPLYAITAGLTFLVVLGIGIWSLVPSTDSPGWSGRFQGYDPESGRATAYCNACGKLNWAEVPHCHYCRAQMPLSHG
jgi:hypothetical protein